MADFHIRTQITHTDVDAIARLHGDLYEEEYGWNREVDDYVRQPLSQFAARSNPRERIWIVEADDRVKGCAAVVQSGEWAQFRWFLLAPELRGIGLGHRLLSDALDFSQSSRYDKIFLLTVAGLGASAALYRRAGFQLAEEKEVSAWGTTVHDQRFELDLRDRLAIVPVSFVPEPDELLEELIRLLEDAVEDGASVGFVSPLDREAATSYWKQCLAETASGKRELLLAWLGARLVGSAQLAYPSQPNGRCRAEVQRLLVHSSARRRGIGSEMMHRLHEIAKRNGRKVLFLNTRTGDPPEKLYESLGYTTVGVIPDFAMNPDGSLNDTTIMYRRL